MTDEVSQFHIHDMKDVLRVMDVATEIRRQREEVGKQLNLEDSVEDLKRRIKETTQITGETLSDEDVEKAIKSYQEGLYQFVPPKNNFENRLAEMYVDRGRIGKRYGIPLAIITGLALTVNVAVKSFQSANLQRKESFVEQEVMDSYIRKQNLESALTVTSNSPLIEILDENDKRDFDKLILEVKSFVDQTESFFGQYVSNNSSKENITLENFGEVSDLGYANQELVNSADNRLSQATEILIRSKQIIESKKQLESLVFEVRSLSPPKLLLEQAESEYNNGLSKLGSKDIHGGQSYIQRLEGIKQDTLDYSVLPSQLDQVYNSVKSVALEQTTLDEAENLRGQGAEYIKQVDIKRSRSAINLLQDLDELLKQEYKLEIVDKPGVKSGIDRYYTDEKGKRVAGFYLIVEARDPSGSVMHQTIKNEENGQDYTVNMWGERVPENVYEQVKEDKISDGRVDDKTFGVKEKGYKNPRVTIKEKKFLNDKPIERSGQITSW